MKKESCFPMSDSNQNDQNWKYIKEWLKSCQIQLHRLYVSVSYNTLYVVDYFPTISPFLTFAVASSVPYINQYILC